MPKHIHIHHPLNPEDNIVIPAKIIRENKRIIRLEEQTEKNVRQRLRQAEREAETVKLAAYQQGYQQGMIDALQQTATYFAGWQAMANHWRTVLIDEARHMLSAAAEHPDTILSVLNEWLAELPDRDGTLYLLMPKSLANTERHYLAEQLAKSWPGTVKIDYHQNAAFIMRCADHIAEYSPEHYLQPSVRLLQQQLNELPGQCQTLSAQALQGVIAFCQQLADNAPARLENATDNSVPQTDTQPEADIQSEADNIARS